VKPQTTIVTKAHKHRSERFTVFLLFLFDLSSSIVRCTVGIGLLAIYLLSFVYFDSGEHVDVINYILQYRNVILADCPAC